ncbi:hypothetical protein F4818DRAFT_443183 [Hypoxylon cercidicola]|nr:hypothetical protein F4818DRAFT_443183 [Hypoxylon cercidicola]
MDYSDPDAFTLPYHRDVYPLFEPIQPELSAKGKTVLITGVSGGIGKRRDYRAARLRSLAPSGTKVLARGGGDITNEASVAALFEAATGAVSKLNVLINSAKSLDLGPVSAVDAAKFNVLGSYLMTHHFLAQADGVGTVVSMTTGAIATVFPGMAGYTASKLAPARRTTGHTRLHTHAGNCPDRDDDRFVEAVCQG